MRRTQNWILFVGVLVILGGVSLVAMGLHKGSSSSNSDDTPRSLAAASQTATKGPSAAQLAAQQRAQNVAALNTALTQYAATVPEFSVAVLDRKTGALYSFRGTTQYATASVVKVQVLACLLLTAQDRNKALTSTERGYATKMIEESDNDSTTALFTELGKAPAIQSCDKRLGLTSTKVATAWGDTETTVNDQVHLLSQLVSTTGPLSQKSRDYAYSLMSTVDPEQQWGVPSVAKPGEKVTVKNGWLQHEADDNRWIINTVGRIVGPNTDVSIAVLSHNHETQAAGEAVVQKVAQLTRQYLKY